MISGQFEQLIENSSSILVASYSNSINLFQLTPFIRTKLVEFKKNKQVMNSVSKSSSLKKRQEWGLLEGKVNAIE